MSLSTLGAFILETEARRRERNSLLQMQCKICCSGSLAGRGAPRFTRKSYPAQPWREPLPRHYPLEETRQTSAHLASSHPSSPPLVAAVMCRVLSAAVSGGPQSGVWRRIAFLAFLAFLASAFARLAAAISSMLRTVSGRSLPQRFR